MAAGDLRAARALLEEAAATGGDLESWMSLAAVRRGLGDLPAAIAAVDHALALDPRYFLGLLMRASLIERLGDETAAALAYGAALTQAPPNDMLDEATRRATQRAREAHARYLAGLESTLRQEVAGAGGVAGRRASVFIDRLVGKRRAYHPEPVKFHYPGLPELEFHDREQFPWIEAFEAQTDAILAELEAVLADRSQALTPYVNYADGIPLDQWAELNRSSRWSAYHLWFNGSELAPHAARCPRTMQAMEPLPRPFVPLRGPAAMFSLLEPRTRIPPHTGITNTRLVVHLPLVIPPGCGFRVGSETRAWRKGEAWVFDDTVEHEAWNDSDAPRTILICDVWNPYLSLEERELITRVISGVDRVSGARPEESGL